MSAKGIYNGDIQFEIIRREELLALADGSVTQVNRIILFPNQL